MGKLLKFGKPNTNVVENQPEALSQAEIEACEFAKSLREMFDQDDIDEIIAELETEDTVGS